jgi:uncharacterized membrane protein YoaK (UPF0700 family)
MFSQLKMQKLQLNLQNIFLGFSMVQLVQNATFRHLLGDQSTGHTKV